VQRVVAFPRIVNDKAARVVAGGVVLMAAACLLTPADWVLVPLAYGFWARVLTGPTLSPLALLATRVVAPRLGAARPVPGPPKRFAQAIGAALSTAALVAWAGFGDVGVAHALVAALLAAASLEAFAGLCLGCTIFAGLMRVGLIPGAVCVECADLRRRINA
jgi:hypothetical protein